MIKYISKNQFLSMKTQTQLEVIENKKRQFQIL